MSYILDALKKAEADRDPDARASLAMVQHERRRNRWLAYAAVIALIVNAAILLWLFLPDAVDQAGSLSRPGAETQTQTQTQTNERQSQQVQRPQQDQPAATRSAIPAEPAPRRQAPVSQPSQASNTTTSEPAAPRGTMASESATGETIIGPGSGAAPAADALPVSSLPNAQRGRFPTLEFSTHIYADDADLRAIVVNGSRLEEGDRLGNLRLQEITEDGAVFRFEDRLVSVSVLDDWE